MEKSSQIACEIVPLRHFFPAKGCPAYRSSPVPSYLNEASSKNPQFGLHPRVGGSGYRPQIKLKDPSGLVKSLLAWNLLGLLRSFYKQGLVRP
jgi:hypothetical protein